MSGIQFRLVSAGYNGDQYGVNYGQGGGDDGAGDCPIEGGGYPSGGDTVNINYPFGIGVENTEGDAQGVADAYTDTAYSEEVPGGDTTVEYPGETPEGEYPGDNSPVEDGSDNPYNPPPAAEETPPPENPYNPETPEVPANPEPENPETPAPPPAVETPAPVEEEAPKQPTVYKINGDFEINGDPHVFVANGDGTGRYLGDITVDRLTPFNWVNENGQGGSMEIVTQETGDGRHYTEIVRTQFASTLRGKPVKVAVDTNPNTGRTDLNVINGRGNTEHYSISNLNEDNSFTVGSHRVAAGDVYTINEMHGVTTTAEFATAENGERMILLTTTDANGNEQTVEIRRPEVWGAGNGHLNVSMDLAEETEDTLLFKLQDGSVRPAFGDMTIQEVLEERRQALGVANQPLPVNE